MCIINLPCGVLQKYPFRDTNAHPLVMNNMFNHLSSNGTGQTESGYAGFPTPDLLLKQFKVFVGSLNYLSSELSALLLSLTCVLGVAL